MLAGGVAALLAGTVMMASGGVVPAVASDGASLMLAKKVKQLDGSYVDAARDLRPGDSVSFWVEFRVNDADADAPVLVQDVLPVEFAGWEITDLTAVVGGSASGITLDLPGVATGPAPEGPVAGIVGGSDTERTISVGVEQRVQSGPANPDGLGMSTRDTGVLEYTLKVPEHLAADDPILRRDLVNTATFSAKAGERELRVSDDAVIAIDNPIRAGVTPSKTWSPEQQGYEPGAASEITIGATQSSNVNASVLRLQDPADPVLTPDGATELRAGNPFSAVDFAGFTAPTDPTTNLPTGATTATVEVYRLAAGSWNWVPWDASIPNGEIAGVRTSYAGEIPPGTVVTQGFSATQRATHRTTGESQSQGFAVTNDVRATVEVPGMDPVSADANAPFTVATETIGVDAQKRFLELPNGSETAQLSGVTAGDSVGVVLRATNRDAPASAVLDRLTIAEPAEGSSPLFFGEDLLFAGFDTSVPEAVWPAGASAAELTWRFTDDSEETVALSPHEALPAPAAGKIVAGFELSFTGEIQPGATSEVKYQLDSNPADSFVQPGKKTENLTNAILVTGERGDHEPATATAKATVAFVAPSIETSIQKRVGPGVVTPGQDVIVQLDTVVKTSGGRTQPTEIVVEDVLGDAGTFWDGFDAKQVLPPITRPANNDTPTTQADLTISVQNAAGDWTQLAHNPVDDAPIDIPQGATGIRFVYSNPTGFSQTTLVKPNVSFTARNTLRSDAKTPTATEFTKVVHYENVATVTATGKLGDREVTGTATSKVNAGIRATPGGNGTGPGVGGTLWADKQWAHDTLRSQSGTRTFSTQSWALTKHGFPRVELQDPVSPTASGQGTVFEAFNLTHVRPIHFAGGGANVTQDPMLQWDLVTAVELWDGTAWVPVEAPAAGWMDAKGFTGYALTPEQRESTLGVRLVLGENTAAREAAHDPSDPDLTVPAPGTGVSASGEIRSFGLEWQLRDIARTADGTVKWVKETDTQFNCDGGDGCIDNLFAVTAIPDTGRPATATANDTIQILDGVPNVTLEKQVSALPGGTPGETIGMIAPNPGEVAQEDYPSARYSLTAGNASEAADGAVGRMRLGQIRVTDAAGPNDDSALSIDASPFTGRDFAKESSEQGGNRFNEFTLTGVTFGALPGSIDTAESTVELWLFDGTPAGKTERWTLQQVLDGDPGFAAALPDAIGVSALYSGTDPATHGNRITTSDKLVMHLDVQLRKTERVSGETVTGGQRGSVTSLPNEASVRGWDAVINPEARPTRRDDATIELTQATVEVGLKKSVSVNHTSGSNDTVYESAPDAPVRVELVANPNGSSAPIDTLTVRDTTKAFWDRFELVSFETPTLPEGADRARLQVYVGEKWVSYDGYTGDFSAIHGVGVTFDRNDARTFPQGAASWTGSWKSAKLAVGVKLREGASVNWKSDSVKNLATVVAKNNTFGSAEAEAIDDVRFSPGDHKLRVEKRAPNDTSTHQVEALTSAPWKLVFTNTGSSLLPITQVTDALPETLTWDGEDPVVTSVATTGGATELGTAPKVTLSDDGRNLVFDWGKGARMQPGEQVTISLGLIMAPMAAGKRAVNEVIVETGVTLAECVQPTEHGQAPGAVNAPNVCSNTNYVQPRIGTVVGARKTVSGESVPTLGEDLVTGALDTVTGDECRPGNYLPTGSDYTRSPCASYTAIGATDSWKLENINSGTNPLTRMTVVDMLPAPGDRMLAGGAARGSTFAPVLKDLANIRVSGLPEGASYTVEVTENPAACVGTGGDGSLWASDPECADTTANPANQWTPLASFTGAAHNVAGLRFQVDMTAQPLQPGGTIVVEFETVNRVLDGAGAAGTLGTSDAALRPTLAQFQEQQFAWNQNGVVGWGPTGVRVNLPAAPQRAGVTVKTDSLTLSKETTGLAQDRAPKSFDIELSCTVPSGSATGPERVALDLGEQARVTVPKNGSVTIDGMPVGADCSVREAGALGSYGENTRAVDLSPGVFPAADGQSADVQIREREGGPIEVLFVNGYAPIPPVPTDKPKPPPEPKNPAPPTSPVLPGEPGSTPTALLPETGGTGFGIFAAAAALVLLLGAALAAAGGARGRRGAHGAAD